MMSFIRMALHAHARTARAFAVIAMTAAGVLLVLLPSGPLEVAAVFMVGAIYGWAITHMLNVHQRRMDMRLVREAVDIIPPHCEGMCKRRTPWTDEERTAFDANPAVLIEIEHIEFNA